MLLRLVLLLLLLLFLHHFVLLLLLLWYGFLVDGVLRNYRRLVMGRPGADVASTGVLLCGGRRIMHMLILGVRVSSFGFFEGARDGHVRRRRIRRARCPLFGTDQRCR